MLVVRYGARSFATHCLTLPAVEVRRLYRLRAQIEEVIRVCKDQLGLTACQARSERAQQHHFTCCLVAFCVLERERHDRGLTLDKLKRQLSYQGRTVGLPALERLSRLLKNSLSRHRNGISQAISKISNQRNQRVAKTA